MSPRRLRWTSLACLGLSALAALTGFFAQVLLILGVLFFHITVLIPVGAVGGEVGPTTWPVPRVPPPALVVASLLLVLALVCFFKSTRSAGSPGRLAVPAEDRQEG